MADKDDRQRQNKKQAPDPHAGGATASKVDATALKLLDQGVPEQCGRVSCKLLLSSLLLLLLLLLSLLLLLNIAVKLPTQHLQYQLQTWKQCKY